MSRPALSSQQQPQPQSHRTPSSAGTAASSPLTTTAATTPNATSTAGSTTSGSNAANQLPHDISHLLGTPITLKLSSGGTASGLLWAHDVGLGVVVLETGVVTPSPIPETAVASPVASRSSNARSSVAGNERRTGFRIVKVRDIKGLSVDADVSGGSAAPTTLSATYPVNVAAAEAREAAAVRDGMTRASRKGKGVSALAQDVFDALCKTLPCRWHEKHIIVMDEISISGPAYDASSTNVPAIPQDRLRALLDPSGSALNEASVAEKAKINSYNRVVKVLEGERKKILARQALSVPSSAPPSSDGPNAKGG